MFYWKKRREIGLWKGQSQKAQTEWLVHLRIEDWGELNEKFWDAWERGLKETKGPDSKKYWKCSEDARQESDRGLSQKLIDS